MWKTNFDKDDVARKMSRHLVSPVKESESNMKEEKSHKDDDISGGEKEVEVTIILKFTIYSYNIL